METTFQMMTTSKSFQERDGRMSKQRYLLKSKARNVIINALSKKEYAKGHCIKSAKEIWDTLTISYEGSTEWRPHTTTPTTLKVDKLIKEQSKNEEANLCLMVGI